MPNCEMQVKFSSIYFQYLFSCNILCQQLLTSILHKASQTVAGLTYQGFSFPLKSLITTVTSHFCWRMVPSCPVVRNDLSYTSSESLLCLVQCYQEDNQRQGFNDPHFIILESPNKNLENSFYYQKMTSPTSQQVKNPPALQEDTGDSGSILEWEDPWSRNGKPLQYSC